MSVNYPFRKFFYSHLKSSQSKANIKILCNLRNSFQFNVCFLRLFSSNKLNEMVLCNIINRKKADMRCQKKASKYNKISQQNKFHLLTLVLGDKMAIKDAARKVGINYSTAKTIIFFYRNNRKSYQFDFAYSYVYCKTGATRAGWIDIFGEVNIQENQVLVPPEIFVVSTIGLRSWEGETQVEFKQLYKISQQQSGPEKILSKISSHSKQEREYQGHSCSNLHENNVNLCKQLYQLSFQHKLSLILKKQQADKNKFRQLSSHSGRI